MTAEQLLAIACTRGIVFIANQDGFSADLTAPGYQIRAHKRIPYGEAWCGWWDLYLAHNGVPVGDEFDALTVEGPNQIPPALESLKDRACYLAAQSAC